MNRFEEIIPVLSPEELAKQAAVAQVTDAIMAHNQQYGAGSFAVSGGEATSRPLTPEQQQVADALMFAEAQRDGRIDLNERGDIIPSFAEYNQTTENAARGTQHPLDLPLRELGWNVGERVSTSGLPPSYQIQNTPWSNYDENGNWMGLVNGPNEGRGVTIPPSPLPHYEPGWNGGIRERDPLFGTGVNRDLSPHIQGIPRHPTYGFFGGAGYGWGYGNDRMTPIDDLDNLYRLHDMGFDHNDTKKSYLANKDFIERLDRMRANPNSDWNNGKIQRLGWNHGLAARWYFEREVLKYEDANSLPRTNFNTILSGEGDGGGGF